MNPALGAVIPAAGRSTRMGRSKPLLPLWGSDFMGTLIGALRLPEVGAGDIAVVVRADDRLLGERLAALAGPDLHVVAASEPLGDMMASVIRGAAALPDVGAVIVWPVDAPAVSPATVARVADAARSHVAAGAATGPDPVTGRGPGSWAVIPTHQGRDGHPVAVAPGLLSGPPAATGGLRALLAHPGVRIQRIQVADPGCVLNVNTPEDYERLGPIGTTPAWAG